MAFNGCCWDAYSVSRLLRGRILDQQGISIADIDNISFKNGAVNQLIVSYDKTLGLGGKKAVLNYGDTKIMRNGDAVDLQLSEEKSAQLIILPHHANSTPFKNT